MLVKLENILNNIYAGKVLDIATGAGDFIEFIKNMSQLESVTAIDELEIMGELIKKRHPEENIHFKKMNAHHLDFEDYSFDTVCISNSLHHFTDVNQVIQEAVRVLKKGGLLIINEMCSDELNPAQQSHDKMHRFVAKLDQKRGMSHQPTMSKKEISQIIQNTDLIEVDHFEFYFPIPESQQASVIERNINVLDLQLESFQNDPEILQLRNEAENIKEYMRMNGFTQATSLLFVLQ
ncbi:MAG TPA: methyltransferase domain-containing protein [Candidatus Cloacimonadota bacterium]|nr:methyltransferase domain-containing protein [Candidatus Cloacimonadota bacterium]